MTPSELFATAGLRERCESAKETFADLKYGDRVRSKVTDREYRVTSGMSYRVFSYNEGGCHGSDEGGSFWVPMISIHVQDRNDEFGGVLAVPAYYFETVEDEQCQ